MRLRSEWLAASKMKQFWCHLEDEDREDGEIINAEKPREAAKLFMRNVWDDRCLDTEMPRRLGVMVHFEERVILYRVDVDWEPVFFF